METRLNIQPEFRAAPLPAGFLLGAATSSHQVEGNNRWNDWWAFEQAGQLPFQSQQCCDHYRLYEQDFDLAGSLGHSCHRFSIEWSRIEPAEGAWNDAAVEHYADVIRALRARGMEPVVTLQHFTLPAWFAARGGWERADSPQLFARFLAHLLERLTEPVMFWLTINEPTVYVQQSYVNGAWPPQQRAAWRKAVRVLRNLARAHVAAYDVVKQHQPRALISFAHNALLVEPCNPRRLLDRLAARCRDYVLNDVFFRLIRSAGADDSQLKLDFVGINYYTRCCVRSAGGPLTRLLGRACKAAHHQHQGSNSDIGWEIYPRGLKAVLARFAGFGLPMFVTENGIATDNDELRCAFLQDHVRVLSDAVAEGIPVIGYLHWSLMDNFEWDLGTKAKFGLAAVDYRTQARRPRHSAELFARLCREHQTPGCQEIS